VLRRDAPTVREDVLAGAGLCLAGMFSGSPLLMGPTILLARGFRASPLRAVLVSCVLVCASFLICQSPWIIRNTIVLGAPVLTRTTYPIAAYMANMPGPALSHLVVINSNEKESALYAELGEIRYQRLCRERFRDEVRAYPKDYAIRCTYRLFQLWGGRNSAWCAGILLARARGSEKIQYVDHSLLQPPDVYPSPTVDEWIWEGYAWGTALLALIGGFGMARIGRGREAMLLASALVVVSLVYIPCHVEDLFRAPFLSILALLAAFGVERLTGVSQWGVSRPYPHAVVRAGEALSRFLIPQPGSQASLWDGLWRSLITAPAVAFLIVFPFALEVTVVNRAAISRSFFLSTKFLGIVLVVFVLDLVRRALGSWGALHRRPRSNSADF
jgi:hypothetical protein